MQTFDKEKLIQEIRDWYLDADIQAASKDPCVIDAMIDLFIRTVRELPADDAVPVIRCRCCKYYSEKSMMCRKWSKFGTVMTIPAGFCHKGELREP